MQFPPTLAQITTMAILGMQATVACAAGALIDPKDLVSRSNPSVRAIVPEMLVSTQRIRTGTWSPDGTQIAFSAGISGRMNLWIVPALGGWPVPLTASDQAQTEPLWSPDGKWIAFTSDTDGNELFDIFLVSPETGEVLNLTHTAEDKESDLRWSPDGSKLAYILRAKGEAYYRARSVDLATREVIDLSPSVPVDEHCFDLVWSRDGKQVAFSAWDASIASSGVWVFDLASHASRPLIPREEGKWYSPAGWSKDDSQLLLFSTALNGKANVALYDLASRELTWLTRSEWESGPAEWSPDGRTICWVTNADGRIDPYLYDVATRRTAPISVPPGMNSLSSLRSYSNDSSKLLFYHTDSSTPDCLMGYSITSGKSWQITEPLPAALSPSSFAPSNLVHFRSKDDKFEISAYAWVPANLARDASHPLIVAVHGGPLSQNYDQYQPMLQYLVSLGYLVIAPNYRGSSGYGQAFADANSHDFGGGDLEDLVSAADWMVKSGYVDPKKQILLGGSYGGFMTLTGLAKTPERWAAGVAIVPFANWQTMLEADPTNREYFIEKLGDPVKEKALWDERSPINFADQIRAPLLMQAGGQDVRCPKAQAQAIVDAVTSRGGVAELTVYENEGHGFDRRENKVDSFRRIGEFLLKHVPPPAKRSSR